MNRKEAIEILKDLWTYLQTDIRQALEMAIKALEQEPSGDLISRQAVLKTLDDMDNALDEDRTVENYKELLKECYEVLPPANPQKIGHWIKRSSIGVYECSVCKTTTCIDDIGHYNFCPNCGARMESEK